jgi:hypothetical protein
MIENIKEDFKLCCQSIDQPKRLVKRIRNIYSKYFLQIHRNPQINLFDYDRQRTYFERTNQRLQIKIQSDIQNEEKQQIRNIQVIIHLPLIFIEISFAFQGTNEYDARNFILLFESCSSRKNFIRFGYCIEYC